MFRTAILALLAAAAGATLTAQDVVFRTSVDLVTVDATVIGRDGRPVPDLGPDDFILEVNGRRRRVVSAQFVDQPPPGVRPAPLRAGHFSSNEDLDTGRIVVVAVDEAHIRRLEGRPALQAAGRFLDTLHPLDLAAVVGLSNVGVVELTRDRRRLQRQLGGLVGHGDPVFLQFNIGLVEAIEITNGSRWRFSEVVRRECGRALSEYLNPNRLADEEAGRDPCPEHVEQEARAVAEHARTQARISLSALGALVDALRAMDGPKTIVLLSEGMVVDPRLVDLGQLAAAAREARVAIYGLHLEAPVFEAAQDRVSPSMLLDMQVRGDGLSRIAGAARGTVFRLVGGDPGPFSRVEQEISGYYLLAFEPTAADRDGRPHRIRVKLARGGAEIRAREAFRLSPARPSPRVREEELVLLLRQTSPMVELPVRVATYTYAEPTETTRVVVSIEAEPPSGRVADVLLGYVLIDEHGVIAASGAHRPSGARYAFSTRVPPGEYTLRVGGIDPLGRKGLVQRAFTAGVRAENGLRVGDLMLAPMPSRPDAPLEPFVDRIDAARAVAYLELESAADEALGVSAVAIEIATGEGRDTGIRGRADVTTDGRWAVAKVTLPLQGLTTGPYVAVARVLRDDVEIARVTRPFTVAR